MLRTKALDQRLLTPKCSNGNALNAGASCWCLLFRYTHTVAVVMNRLIHRSINSSNGLHFRVVSRFRNRPSGILAEAPMFREWRCSEKRARKAIIVVLVGGMVGLNVPAAFAGQLSSETAAAKVSTPDVMTAPAM